MYAQSLIVPQLLQLPAETGFGLGRSMFAMGLWMAPSGVMMMLVSPLGARLSAGRGPKVTLLVGALVIAFGYGSSTVLMGSTWGPLVVTSICGAGVGLAYGAMPALIMGSVSQTATAAANRFNSLMRSVGTSVSAAVVGVVLAQMSMPFGEHTLPTDAGFRTGLLIGCGVAVVAALITLAIPGKPVGPIVGFRHPRGGAGRVPRMKRPRPCGRGLFVGVSDGTRTRDSQDHNLVLYQLNYTHHCIRDRPGPVATAIEILACFPENDESPGQAGPRSFTTAVMSADDGPGAATNAVRR